MTIFTDIAPRMVRDLMRDFALSAEDGAAIAGNAGHESGGFRFMQEIKPVVPGSRGGFGWFMWTGPRRVAFEKFCAAHKLDPRSYEANYGFLGVELRGSEKAAIPAIRKASGLYNKVVAFEKSFERSGVKAYASRLKYAEEALAAYHAAPPQGSPPASEPPPPVSDAHPPAETPPAPSPTLWDRFVAVVAFFRRVFGRG